MLPYIDLIRFTVIDPMHNLFLGTAKHMLHNIWLAKGLLSHAEADHIQNIINSCRVPSSVGRIPHKILSSFSGFTADQWKNWVLMYSLPSLFSVLPPSDLKCWRKFVVACICLCSPTLKVSDVKKAHDQLVSFFHDCVSNYGPSVATINMHLHQHLQDCVMDYGPLYSFWLFPFERYNGILGSYHTNQRSIEIQVMRKFLEDSEIKHAMYSDVPSIKDHIDLFQPLLNKSPGGTASESLFPGQAIVTSPGDVSALLQLPIIPVQPCMAFLTGQNASFLSPFVRSYFDADSLHYLKLSYSTFIPDLNPTNVPRMFDCYNAVTLWGDRIGSEKSKLERCKYILGNWVGANGKIANSSLDTRPGIVEYFFKQRVCVKETFYTVSMASVRWYKPHQQRHSLNEPLELYVPDLFEPYGPSSFIPLTRIKSLCVVCPVKLNEESVIVVYPIKKKLYI